MRMSTFYHSQIMMNRTDLMDDILNEIPAELLILSSDLRLMDTLGQGI